MKSGFFKKSKILMLFGLSMGLAPITSCSAFFDSGYSIADITQTTDENGNTILEITFDNEDVEPIKVTIKNGIGIDDITSEMIDGILYLNIHYSDGSNPTVIEIPVIKGDDGRSVTGIDTRIDDLGNTIIVFTFSDGTKSNEITIPKGNDGRGVSDISCVLNEQTNQYELIFTLSDGTEIGPFYINNGKDGKEIVSINTNETDNNYILEIVYSDGTITPIILSKPTTNRWYTGTSIPNEDLGEVGDFYFDTANKSIYTKTSLGRSLLLNLDNDNEDKYFNISFDTNGGQWKYIDVSSEDSQSKVRTFSIKENSFIDLDNEMLQVFMDGYTFDGWWSDAIITANSGHFTKLTPVTSEIILYAKRIENL